MSTFFEPIQKADTWLLTLINFDGPTAYDSFWMLYTNRLTWIPLAIAAVWCLWRRGGWRNALLITIAIGLMFLISDFVVAGLIKPLVARPRPSHDSQVMYLLSFVNDYHGGRYGFPSNHASNGFAAATMLSLLFRRRVIAVTAFLWAIGSCYSRMYLGVHYPTDILTGALIGMVAAFLFHWLYRRCYRRMKTPWQLPPYSTLYAGREPWPISLTFLATVVVLLLCSLVQ